MQLTLSQKKLYVKRLKSMIEKYEKEPSMHCPIQPCFRIKQNMIKGFDGFSVAICKFCVNFVGGLPSFYLTCPCYQLDPKEAILRAKKAIIKFEEENVR